MVQEEQALLTTITILTPGKPLSTADGPQVRCNDTMQGGGYSKRRLCYHRSPLQIGLM